MSQPAELSSSSSSNSSIKPNAEPTVDSLFADAAKAFGLKPEIKKFVLQSEHFPTIDDIPSEPVTPPITDFTPESVDQLFSGPQSETPIFNRTNNNNSFDEFSPEDIFARTAAAFDNPGMMETIWNETEFIVPNDKRLNDSVKARKLSEYEKMFANRYNDESFEAKKEFPEPFILWPMRPRNPAVSKKPAKVKNDSAKK